MKKYILLQIFFCFCCLYVKAQFGQRTYWSKDNKGLFELRDNQILLRDLTSGNHSRVIVSKEQLKPQGDSTSLKIRRYVFSEDQSKLLLNTNTRKVWRYDTRGDFWVFDRSSAKLVRLGKSFPESFLMFAKFSPDGKKVAYVVAHNIYVEEIATGKITQLTHDGTSRIINGTFDWAYEEEFDCRDGFRWSPDGKSIAFWKLNASGIRNYLMLNTTDSIYSFNVPVEYPKAGQDPSGCSVHIVNVSSGKIEKVDVPGDSRQNYIPRMEWSPDSKGIILQQLNRLQTESKIFYWASDTKSAKLVYSEKDDAWIDVKARFSNDPTGWEWLDGGKAFLWISEKDGWRHFYRIDLNGKETRLFSDEFDVIHFNNIDEKSDYAYFMASPENATQSYLYRVRLDGTSKPQRLSPRDQSGTHSYDIAPGARNAIHRFSSSMVPYSTEIISLPDHRSLSGNIKNRDTGARSVEFFKVTTSEGVEMDGWMVKPDNFNSSKKYPVVFYVYGEPAGQTVTDTYGIGSNRLYPGMAKDGYIYISLENRGAPAPKGREWRKSIYKNIGIVNVRDQALGAIEILKWPFVDPERIAVWGWSGGGSSTLNLLFQYPEIYKTGIAIAAVSNQLTYDNIYQERYMGNPAIDKNPFLKGSPITHAKNLKGSLLLVHGTGDDNVHYQNAEMLINELVKNQKQFSLMSYPNRSHSISEGDGTSAHLSTMFTNYLKQYCPPGGR